MNIAFIGHSNSVNFNKIGGTDAIVRRIAKTLASTNDIYILTYGHLDDSTVRISKSILQIKFKELTSLLSYIKAKNIQQNISIYIRPIDRLKILIFRIANKGLYFHTVITVYNHKPIKRWLLFFESTLTYNGKIFCVSKRIFKEISRISSKGIYLPPPVEDSFFSCSAINSKQKIRISYMGRLDYGKGADIAIDFFLNNTLPRDKYEFYMYSYPWKDDAFSLALDKDLKSQSKIKYISTNIYNYTPNVDSILQKQIDDTDLFLLPYRFMTSTIDMPLVPLEVAARNRAYITSNIKGMKELRMKDVGVISPVSKKLNKEIQALIITYFDKSLDERTNQHEKNIKYKASYISNTLIANIAPPP